MWRTASILIGIVLLLITLGIVMLASTSGVQGEDQFHDPNYFMKRQVAALVVGIVAAAFATRFDYRYWRALAMPIAAVTVLLLVMAVTPGIGKSVKGSSRWLHMAGVTFQPSELGKFASILVLAWWMSRVQRKAGDLKVGLLVPGLLLGGMAILILVEPDFGTTMLMAAVGGAIMFVGGTRPGHLIVALTMGFSAILLMIMEDDERMRRIAAFLNPEKYAQDEAYQLLNAIYAFVVGGLTGVGLGGSLQKQFYLPEAHTDFIFAIVGEELGLGFSIAVIVLFLGFFLCGLRISMRATDMFGRLTAFGITSMITVQAAINMGVVTGCLPTKGLPMPFISYGGTSLAVTLMMVGVLVNIAMQAGSENPDEDIPAVKDRVHRL
jgi:cell division protein FtsW